MRFDVAGLCFTDARGIAFQHDPKLVALSYIIAVGGSFTALEMIERWRNARGAPACYWQLGSAAALGGSIWSMHFIGILALTVGFPLTYAPGATLLSLLIAIGVMVCGLQIIRAGSSWIRVGGAGITIGLGVAAMHYVGMSGVRFPGSLAYTPSLWGLSLLVAIAAATAALWLSLTLQKTWQRGVAAVAMAGAICGMHYTGMAAAVFQVDPLAQVAPGLPSGLLATGIAIVTSALILCALVFVATDRRLFASRRREIEALRQSNSQLAAANAESEQGRQQLDAVLSNIIQGVCLFDGAHRLLVWNRRYTEIYNLPPEAIRVGCSLTEILQYRAAVGSSPNMPVADYLAMREQVVATNHLADTVVPLKNGQIVSIHHQPMLNGGWVATHEDITERQHAEASIAFMAQHDALTRLPNRLLFHERLNHAMAMAGRGTRCSLLCLDLDKFKLVNDTLGHPVGDGLLQAAADRLQACLREGDTVARLGGDEFAIIQLAIERPDDAGLLANRIIAAFRKPFDVDGHQITIGTSIGVTVAPDDATLPETFLKNADIALYLAKLAGRGTVRFFEPGMDTRIRARRNLESDLRDAIAHNEFEIYYQPLVNVKGNKITGFEALLRWHHPVRGLVPPLEFIPVAEETGMIVAIGEWVLRMACFEAENWPANISIAVNLSPVQFKEGNLVASVQAALDASGLQPHRLELEITESVLLHDSVGTLTALHRLRAMGISIALDDFGTGYSSLSYLRSFPFDKIKIDQSFVRDMVKNKESMAIIRAITGLGQSLQMTTTAEGVETVEQLDVLRKEGCTQVQGYFFSRPRPASELPLLINRLQQVSEGTLSQTLGPA
jgi:diguanylate cyclase (GGDEF)-like protein